MKDESSSALKDDSSTSPTAAHFFPVSSPEIGIIFPANEDGKACWFSYAERYRQTIFGSLAEITNEYESVVRKNLSSFITKRLRCKWLASLLSKTVGKQEGSLAAQPELCLKRSYKGSLFVLAVASLAYSLDIFTITTPQKNDPPVKPEQLRRQMAAVKIPASEFLLEQSTRPKAVFFSFINLNKPWSRKSPNQYALLKPSSRTLSKHAESILAWGDFAASASDERPAVERDGKEAKQEEIGQESKATEDSDDETVYSDAESEASIEYGLEPNTDVQETRKRPRTPNASDPNSTPRKRVKVRDLRLYSFSVCVYTD